MYIKGSLRALFFKRARAASKTTIQHKSIENETAINKHSSDACYTYIHMWFNSSGAKIILASAVISLLLMYNYICVSL